MTSDASATDSVLDRLDPVALTAATRREARARQHHLPPISTYRWWARRTETVTGAVVDALADDHEHQPMTIADPFAGGGVIALAVLLRGYRLYAQDVNPWAARSLATMLTLPDAALVNDAADSLRNDLAPLLHNAYATTDAAGEPATIAQTIRVASVGCGGCGDTILLFPTGTISLLTRVDCGGDDAWLACPAGHVQRGPSSRRTRCRTCNRIIDPKGRYTPGRTARCTSCKWTGKIADVGPMSWEIVLVDRHGPAGRELSPPTAAEVAQASPARWSPTRALDRIDSGIETSVLTRHGFTHWHDLYPHRQRVVLEALFAACEHADPAVRGALEAAAYGCVEMAGYLSRWDPRYLKSYEAVANHRYNVTTLAAEPNVWGVPGSGRGTFEKRVAHLAKASKWYDGRIGRRLHVDGPRDAQSRRSPLPGDVDARVVSGGSQRLLVPDGHLDAVVTDPPYHDDVQYAELSNLFRAWAQMETGTLDGDAVVGLLTGPASTDRYQQLLTEVFSEVRRALKADGHLVLSYANRYPSAWVALFSALHAAGFHAAGYTVVHSENEADHAKTGRRACNLDILLDLTPTPATRPFAPTASLGAGDEETYCHIIGRQFLAVGALTDDWAAAFTDQLRTSAFLARSLG